MTNIFQDKISERAIAREPVYRRPKKLIDQNFGTVTFFLNK